MLILVTLRVQLSLALGFAVLTIFSVDDPVFGQLRQGTQRADAVFDFDIPPQSLDSALAAYARVSGLPLLYDSALTRGRRSNGVRGRMPASRALTRLLDGAGVGVRFTADGSAAIVRLTAPAIRLAPVNVRATPMIGGGPNAEAVAYAQLVQEETKAALRRNPVSRAASYLVSVRLWIDKAGAVTRCAPIDAATGAEADRLCDVARTVTFSRPPPAGLPQPLRIEFRARPAAPPSGS
jgi:Secretin and TonB N terminus short domain